MEARLRTLLVGTALCLISCSSLDPVTLPLSEVQSPGFFDIGIGFGRVSDTRGMDNDDAEGVVASLKAYPLGRWYSEPKQRQLGITPQRRLALETLRDAPDERRRAVFRLQDGGIGEASITDFERDLQQVIEALDDPQRLAADLENLGTLLAQLDGDAAEAARRLSGLGSQVRKDMLAAIVGPRDALREARQVAGELLRDPEVRWQLDRLRAVRVAQSTEALEDAERKQLDTIIAAKDTPPNWHVIEERAEWYNRFSVFYGRSVTDFDSGGLQSEVNVVGLGFDVSPDLALQLGWAFYEVDEMGNGMTDSDGSLYFGVSLNLFSFRSLAQAIVNAGQ